ncbi:MAG: hypothetical protein SGPRY_008917, partial [Prymnesium sp.]
FGEKSEETLYAERLATVAHALVCLLEESTLVDKIAKSCIDWLALEVLAALPLACTLPHD